MSRQKTIDAARGRWREILPKLGVRKKFLSGRNGPCPACGGRDRFRFDDRAKDGDYFCNQCGAGKGIGLVMKVNGWDFKTAAQAVDQIVGNMPVFCGPSEPIDKAHRAARAFFDAQPDFPQDVRSGAALNVLMDENVSFDNAMEIVSRLSRKSFTEYEPSKATRDATLWLRKFHPERLPAWLRKHGDPDLEMWINRERPFGYWLNDKRYACDDGSLTTIKRR